MGWGGELVLFCYGLNRQPEKCATEGGKVLMKGPKETLALLPSSFSSDVLEWRELGAAG